MSHNSSLHIQIPASVFPVPWSGAVLEPIVIRSVITSMGDVWVL